MMGSVRLFVRQRLSDHSAQAHNFVISSLIWFPGLIKIASQCICL